jgi:hypothetical protein
MTSHQEEPLATGSGPTTEAGPLGKVDPVVAPPPGKAVRPAARAASGAPGGIRTPDLLIRSQSLYPLSYGRAMADDTRPFGPVRGASDGPVDG